VGIRKSALIETMKIIKDRHDFIKEYCKGKVVLDIGCMGSSFESDNPYTPSFSQSIQSVAKKVYGLDFPSQKNRGIKKESDKLTMIYGNANSFDLSKQIPKVDIVTAGELVEHLDNFRGFFDSVKKHLKKGGLLIITTPNPYSIMTQVRLPLTGKPMDNPLHTVLFDPYTFGRMAGINRFEVIEWRYATELAPQRIRNMFMRTIGLIIPWMNNDFFMVCKYTGKKLRIEEGK
jgi:SAM-dependent methyltransferase